MGSKRFQMGMMHAISIMSAEQVWDAARGAPRLGGKADPGIPMSRCCSLWRKPTSSGKSSS